MGKTLLALSVLVLCWMNSSNAQDPKIVAPDTKAATPTTSEKGRSEPIPDEIWKEMDGKSWHASLHCPKRTELSLLHLPYVDFGGTPQIGELIVSEKVAAEVIEIFGKLYESGFRINSMRLIDEFRGDDDASMKANNTSAFNCRAKTNGTSLSEHAYGQAIDINPVQNPYVSGSETSPKEGVQFNDKAKRQQPAVGLIREGDSVVKTFASAGWKWGGSWKSLKDYQHFSKSGR
jgi:poly-gamma-glutamate synthesis protein (capsule biosynthesis protein)